MGSTTIKLVKGREYLYYVYYEDRRKIEKYCGLLSKPESEKRALQFELERLNQQKKDLLQKIIEIKSKIDSF